MMDEQSCLSKLARVVMGIEYDKIPDEIVQQAKICLADFLGVFCLGSNKAESQELYSALGGGGLRRSMENLAFWMGGAARLSDLDDGHRFAMGHPGVVVNTTAVACGSLIPTDGKTLITALVRGYEVYCYQGRLVNPSAYLKRGFDATCICGAAGAAAVAGTIMGLTFEQMKGAISLAASLCGGLNQYAIDGGAPKYLCAGWAAKLGIVSAQLAKNGMYGPEHIFEGRLGFANGFAPEPNEKLLHEVALNWEIGKVYLKKYSCVRRIHPTLDVVENICRREKLTPEQIEKITVYGGQFICDAAVYAPKDIVKAQTSVPYTTALLLMYGMVTAELVDGNLDNPEIEKLSGKIEIINDPAFAELAKKEPSLWGASRVEILTTSGDVFRGGENIALGDPENPFSKEAIRDKFIGLVSEATGCKAKKAADFWTLVDTISEKQDTSDLLKSAYAFQ